MDASNVRQSLRAGGRRVAVLGAVLGMLLVAMGREGVAKDLYLRVGAAGTNSGSDWINAWKNFSSVRWGAGAGQLGPGDTLWVAGGNYTDSLIPGANGNPSGWITLKRVRSTDASPTSAPGWNGAYDSQAIINVPGQNAMSIAGFGSYLMVDGRVDSGITFVGQNNPNYFSCVAFSAGASFVTFTNVEFAGPWSGSGLPNMQADTRCINATAYNGNNYSQINNLTVTHCRIHGAGNLLWLYNVYNGLVEYCQMYNCEADNDYHANVIITVGCHNMTVRYNNVYNWQVEGILMLGPNNQPAFNWYIYGNLWHDGYPDPATPRILTCQDTIQGPIYLYNNTFVNCYEGVAVEQNGNWANGSQGRNNIYYNIWGGLSSSPTESLPDDDYDFSDRSQGNNFGNGTHDIANGSQPFVNVGTNYHIVGTIGASYPRNKGLALGAPFNLDIDGNVRGADGGWDIGAYEFTPGGATTNPIIAVSPGSLSFGLQPTGTTNYLTFSVQNAGGGILAGLASVPPPFQIVGNTGVYSLGSNQVQTIKIGYTPSGALSDQQVVTFVGGGGASVTVCGGVR